MQPKSTVLDQEVERFRAYLQRQGLKLTNERRALVREIFSIHYHFDADELTLEVTLTCCNGEGLTWLLTVSMP